MSHPVEVCTRCHKNWFACSCPSTIDWTGEDDEPDESVEDNDDVENLEDYDADELGIDPEYEGE